MYTILKWWTIVRRWRKLFKTNKKKLDNAIYAMYEIIVPNGFHKEDAEVRVEAAKALAQLINAYNNCPEDPEMEDEEEV